MLLPMFVHDLFDQPLQFGPLILPAMMSLNVGTSLSGMLASQRRILLEKCDHMLSEGTGIAGDTDAVLFGSRDAFESFRGSYYNHPHSHGFQYFSLYPPCHSKRRNGNPRPRQIWTNIRNRSGHDHVRMFSKLGYLPRRIATDDIELGSRQRVKYKRKHLLTKILNGVHIRKVIHNTSKNDDSPIVRRRIDRQ